MRAGNVLVWSFLHYLVLASTLRPPKDYEVVSVGGLDEIERDYKKTLKKGKDVVFHINGSNTFLTRRKQEYWDVEETVPEYRKANLHSLDLLFRKVYKQALWNKGLRSLFKLPPIPYVEFFYANFSMTTSRTMLPVSPCHSELLGEGSVIKMQLTEIGRSTPQGTIGVPKSLQRYLTSGEAEVEVEDEHLSTMSIKCTIPHGEVGQIFLSDTEFLNYHTWYRTVMYDQRRKKFIANSEFRKRPLERMVLKGGMGEWLCATSKMIELQCFNVVKDLSVPEREQYDEEETEECDSGEEDSEEKLEDILCEGIEAEETDDEERTADETDDEENDKENDKENEKEYDKENDKETERKKEETNVGSSKPKTRHFAREPIKTMKTYQALKNLNKLRANLPPR